MQPLASFLEQPASKDHVLLKAQKNTATIAVGQATMKDLGISVREGVG
jgi:hypothetical protein